MKGPGEEEVDSWVFMYRAQDGQVAEQDLGVESLL